MAARVDCYVYAVKAEGAIIYIGKGTGNRASVSARRCGGVAEILKRFHREDDAFVYEREMIAMHAPAMNICAGGNGGRAKPKPRAKTPKWLAEIERIGSRVYAARFLVSRLDERNCETWGVSKLDLFRLREVAHGCRA